MNTTFVIRSSNGNWEAHKSDGLLLGELYIHQQYDTGEGRVYIHKFDVAEYVKHYNLASTFDMPNEIDILDLGYWFGLSPVTYSQKGRKKYESPCEEWRSEVAELRKEG